MNRHEYLLVLCTCQLFVLLLAAPITQGNAKNGLWLAALPFKRTLQVESPLLKGKDVVILQNLLRRHKNNFSLPATGYFDETTKVVLRKFQQVENLSQQNGILDPETGKKILQLLMHDGYRDNGIVPDDCKFKIHVPLYRSRSIETNATLYKCGNGGKILHTFKIRARGGTMDGQALNQLTSNGDTPTGLSTLDLNSKEPEELVKAYGPYPVLRVVKGIEGNVAIGKDNVIGVDGKDTFLSNYRFGILIHTGIWDNWNKDLPMPNSLGCMKVHPNDQKKMIDILVNETGAIVNENPFGKLPYPYETQGYISIEEID